MNEKQVRIHENAQLKAGNFKRAEGELICALEEVEREKLYYLLGCSSLSEYCKKHMKLSEDVAMTFIGVMRKSIEIADLKKAVVNDGLSVSQARKIAPILTQNNQEFWINEAKNSSAWELKEKLATHFPERVKRETIRAVNEEYISITIRVKKSDFKTIKRAQELKSKKAKKSASIEETLVDAAKEYAIKYDPVEKAKRVAQKRQATHVNPTPKPISPVTLQVFSNKIPQASLHQVNLRDQGQCQHRSDDDPQRCLSTKFTEIHHIFPKSLGGTHDPSNLITLCSGHHRALHFVSGEFTYSS